MAVGIQKTRCGGINTDNLIESTFFYLKVSWFHVFCSNFSQLCMFCHDDRLKLVLESTRPGEGSSWKIVYNLMKKSEHLLLEKNVSSNAIIILHLLVFSDVSSKISSKRLNSATIEISISWCKKDVFMLSNVSNILFNIFCTAYFIGIYI